MLTLELKRCACEARAHQAAHLFVELQQCLLQLQQCLPQRFLLYYTTLLLQQRFTTLLLYYVTTAPSAFRIPATRICRQRFASLLLEEQQRFTTSLLY